MCNGVIIFIIFFINSTSCECGGFVVEDTPCGCMAYVCQQAGSDVASLIKPRDTIAAWKAQYQDLPSFTIVGTEYISTGKSDLKKPPELPRQAGRPSNKRKAGAMDAIKESAKKHLQREEHEAEKEVQGGQQEQHSPHGTEQ